MEKNSGMKKKCLLRKTNKSYLFIWNTAISGILCCVSAEDMPQIFNSALQAQKPCSSKRGTSPLSVFTFIDFCFSPNATEHHIFFSLNNWHDMKRERECNGSWLLEQSDLLAARGNGIPLRAFPFSLLFCSSRSLS